MQEDRIPFLTWQVIYYNPLEENLQAFSPDPVI